MKKKSFLVSILTIIMCLSLSVGATFALFTSESNVNIAVTSGKVNVVAQIDENSVKTKQLYDTEYTAGKNNMFEGEGVATFTTEGLTLTNVVPGDGIKFNINIVSDSNVTVKYRAIISVVSDDGLFAGLKVKIGDRENYNGLKYFTNWETLSAGPNTVEIPVIIELPENAGNQYQNKNCKISYYVEAVQGNAKTENPIDYDEVNNVYVINNEDGMMLMNGIINTTSHGEGSPLNFALNDDMDMQGYDWLALELHWVNIDGNGHTISNLNCVSNPTLSSYRAPQVGFAAYFGASTISNLTFENVSVSGDQAGIIAGHYEGGMLSNVTIDGTNYVTWEDYAQEEWGGIGAVFGIMVQDMPALRALAAVSFESGSETTIDYNDIVTKCEITGNELCFNNKSITAVVASDAIKIIGDLDESVQGTIVMSDGTYIIYDIDDFFAFKNAVDTNVLGNSADINAILYTDINLSGLSWQPIASPEMPFGGKFDGQGYKITGLTQTAKIDRFALFGAIENAEIKNLVVDGFNVQPANGYYVGGVAACAYATNVFENVTVSNSVIAGYAGVGAIVGYVFQTGVQTKFIDCEISNVDIKVSYDGGTFVGYTSMGTSVVFENSIVSNVDIQLTGHVNGSYYEYKDGMLYRVYENKYFASAGKLYSYESNGGKIKNAQGGVVVDNVTYVSAIAWEEDVVYPRGFIVAGLRDQKQVFYVDNAEGLCYVADHVNTYANNMFINATLGLINDIDLQGIEWTPIGISTDYLFFSSTFEGNGFTIYNLTQTHVPAGGSGLFGSICYATINNLTLYAPRITPPDGYYVGGIAGNAYGNNVFNNVHVKGDLSVMDTGFEISGIGFVGAMVGFINYGTDYSVDFINCSIKTGVMRIAYNSGGFVGYAAYNSKVNFTGCVLDNVVFNLTAGASNYRTDENGLLKVWGDYAALGLLYVDDPNYVGTPVNEQAGVEITRIKYDYSL